MNIASVIVDVPSSSTNQTFDYLIPEQFQGVIQKGMRVIVPFGPRKIMGFVTGVKDDTSLSKVKEIIDVLDISPVLTEELLSLGKWVSEKTLSLSITVLQTMLPQVLKSQYSKDLVRETEAQLPDELEALFAGRESIDFDEIGKSTISYRIIKNHIDSGDLSVSYHVQSRITKKYQTMVIPSKPPIQLEEEIMSLSKNASKQKQLLSYLADHQSEIEKKHLLQITNASAQTLKAIEEKGIVQTYQKEVFRDPYKDQFIEATSPLSLTMEQTQAIEPIKKSMENHTSETFLLHGVTGSGKTEIYLQAIQQVIEEGKEAIVLVPEISLTPQMVKRFKGRFGSKVAVMHSGLSSGEKYDEWRKIHRQEVQVVVGARSAIFAPFENLGIIIIDEEHETTYKQEDQPRYHARDVAIERAEYHQCPVVLGSATPSLESFARASKNVYTLLTLQERTNRQTMPKVDIVDMRNELHAGNRSMFSRPLMEQIDERLRRGEQIVLLLNRRGYSTFVMCRDCGHVCECPHCDIALTYHKNAQRLKCHYCSYEQAVPQICPECESDLIRYFGTGTQKVEEELAKQIPDARVIRMDVDTTRRKGSHENLLKQFSEKKADILLGTQMIAKGLDFANVTLVGVLSADSMLHIPDFRSSERTFQLLTQVSGRAGRHELPGEVIVQTYTPEHYSIEFASEYDYDNFYRKEMAMRKAFQYPPYVFLGLITVAHENHARAIQVTQEIVQMLSNIVERRTTVLGPTPSPVPRIKDRYRYQCMIKYKNEPNLHEYLGHIQDHFSDEIRKQQLQLTIDMQPYYMM
ncbi:MULTISPECIES: primosomal protein N' [Oceanobacillus]|uniref:Replication restart protein PriA n=1 Tax=Oceanobacillus kimchii TaxID=746691 RepID=A0ABQ5TIH2_9BACI|nr:MULTISPECIES: primosomal protein N' [Oceanobacillus]MBT2598762.1 primosomal protein N' [Oceanobacillus sp. ISL-74]MBT2651681.1 primosomal protein N' [Oceanobacillus sp. ISL-73]GLO65942.1 primosomal protein N' [Oceanobacillus kimchii]